MPRAHKLTPLLNPRSVALVGVSERPGSIGKWLLETFVGGGFKGDCRLVNPRYDSIGGRRCYADLGDLPATPDMAVLNVGSSRIEALVDQAIALKIPALTIFDYCVAPPDSDPMLRDRLRHKTRAAGVHVCGGGGMGFYNLDAGVHASYYAAGHLVPGHISLIAHSGSVFTVLAMTDPRFRFNLLVSAGFEMATGLDEYLEFALQLPSTRVVALFIEAVRNPAGLMGALKIAAARDIPVVICKAGKTDASAVFAHTHSGAVAGNQAAFDAMVDRYGAIQVDTLDEMMATAALFAQGRRAGPGGVGAVLDSGGLRQLLVDRAAHYGVEFAELAADTIRRIETHLPHTLTAGNPLDAAGPFSYDYGGIFRHCVRAMAEDPNTAVVWYEFDATDRFNPAPEHEDIALAQMDVNAKPFIVVNSVASTPNTRLGVKFAERGIPLINGVDAALAAVRNLLRYRDMRRRPPPRPPVSPDTAPVRKWRARLAAGRRLPEIEALGLLEDFGVSCVPCRAAHSLETAAAAARAVGFPVVLKTAAAGIDHKTEADGVRLNIAGDDELAAAYRELCGRHGPEVTVAAMAAGGVEIAFGMLRDPQFGSVVMVGAGGTLIELLHDYVPMLAPVEAWEARRHIEALEILPLLKGLRGAAAVDLAALSDALVNFSRLAATLGDLIAEMDVNPLIASADGVLAVDALIVPVQGMTSS